MKAYLDGILVEQPDKSLLYPTFTMQRSTDIDNEIVTNYTSELTFVGAEYNYLYAKLRTDANAINQWVVLSLVDDCCDNKQYQFIIKPESLRWCKGKCELKANALEYSPDSITYQCLYNTLIFDDRNGFQNQPHPRIAYCLEYRPSILQDAMLIIGCATISMISCFIPVILTLQAIINSYNLFVSGVNDLINAFNTFAGQSISNIPQITFFGTGNDDFLHWINDSINTVGAFFVGCGYDHPSPFVRSYIDNVCEICNINWESDILKETNPAMPNNDYYDLAYFNAPIRKGQQASDWWGGYTNYIQRNMPIHNGKTFLDEIVKPFNARWDVNNGLVRIHRKDWFATQVPWLDLTTYDPDKIIIGAECYEWTKNPRPSYGQFYYQKDGVDWVGDEAIEQWGSIVEWNSPYSPLQKGVLDKIFPYGTARFRGDELDRDVLENYEWLPFGMGTAIADNHDVMLMNNGTAFTPKLLIINTFEGGDYDRTHAKIKHGWSTAPNADLPAYNYPMWCKGSSTGNLYDRFWKIENPRNSTFASLDFDITIQYDCATLNAADIDGTIKTSEGLSHRIASIEINTGLSTMRIKGTL